MTTEPNLDPWPGLELIQAVADGNRSQVWRGTAVSGTEPIAVSIRRSRRSSKSLEWELDLMQTLDAAGFRVPTVVRTPAGLRSVDGVVVQRWLEGRQPRSDDDWRLVAAELRRLHELTAGRAQRPGCTSVRDLATARTSVDADLDAMPVDAAAKVVEVFGRLPASVPEAVIHGDPGPENIRIGDDGSVGLLDWDESRVDVVWHDLSNLSVQVLGDDHRAAVRLSHAWEAANGWVVEPAYARRRLSLL